MGCIFSKLLASFGTYRHLFSHISETLSRNFKLSSSYVLIADLSASRLRVSKFFVLTLRIFQNSVTNSKTLIEPSALFILGRTFIAAIVSSQNIFKQVETLCLSIGFGVTAISSSLQNFTVSFLSYSNSFPMSLHGAAFSSFS